MSRVMNLKERRFITSANGQKLFLKCDSICIHGDNDDALEFIKLVRKSLY
jgi:UPF0271 protein